MPFIIPWNFLFSKVRKTISLLVSCFLNVFIKDLYYIGIYHTQVRSTLHLYNNVKSIFEGSKDWQNKKVSGQFV